MSNYKIIDNFLPKEDFEKIFDIINADHFNWFFNNNITFWKDKNSEKKHYWYCTHTLFKKIPTSHHFDNIFEVFKKKSEVMDLYQLHRMKINWYPYVEKFEEHEYHFDYEYQHKGALFSLNTCDGYTKLEDGTKIESVANRMLFFNPSKLHCSTFTSNSQRRLNINFNYF